MQSKGFSLIVIHKCRLAILPQFGENGQPMESEKEFLQFQIDKKVVEIDGV
jgi:hypothetical protein